MSIIIMYKKKMNGNLQRKKIFFYGEICRKYGEYAQKGGNI